MTANAVVSAASGRCPAAAPARNAGTMPAAANSAPVLQATFPSRVWAARAVIEVAMTMIRAAVVAAAGVKPSR
ncbi:hypothetical protein SHIRM173S_10236 [Streptomyces hirsutus]